MDLEADIDVVEDAGADEVDLTVPRLLGRSADEPNLATEVAAEHPGRSDRRPGAGTAHEVVAAAVADLREGVILAGQGHDRAGPIALPAGDECGLEATDRRR